MITIVVGLRLVQRRGRVSGGGGGASVGAEPDSAGDERRRGARGGAAGGGGEVGGAAAGAAAGERGHPPVHALQPRLEQPVLRRPLQVTPCPQNVNGELSFFPQGSSPFFIFISF